MGKIIDTNMLKLNNNKILNNLNIFSNITNGTNIISASNKSDTLTIIGNIVDYDVNNKKLTIDVTPNKIGAATSTEFNKLSNDLAYIFKAIKLEGDISQISDTGVIRIDEVGIVDIISDDNNVQLYAGDEIGLYADGTIFIECENNKGGDINIKSSKNGYVSIDAGTNIELIAVDTITLDTDGPIFIYANDWDNSIELNDRIHLFSGTGYIDMSSAEQYIDISAHTYVNIEARNLDSYIKIHNTDGPTEIDIVADGGYINLHNETVITDTTHINSSIYFKNKDSVNINVGTTSENYITLKAYIQGVMNGTY